MCPGVYWGVLGGGGGGDPKMRKGLLFAQRTPFREKDFYFCEKDFYYG